MFIKLLVDSICKYIFSNKSDINNHLLSNLNTSLLFLIITSIIYLVHLLSLILSIQKGMFCFETLLDLFKSELLFDPDGDTRNKVFSCFYSDSKALMYICNPSMSVGSFSISILKFFHYLTTFRSSAVKPS